MSALSNFLTAWLLGDWTYPSLTFAITTALKGGLVICIAGMLAILLRRRSALLRSWLWRVCMMALASLLIWGFAPSFLERVRPRVKIPPSNMPFVAIAADQWKLVNIKDPERSPEITQDAVPMPSTAAPKPLEVSAMEVRVPWMMQIERSVVLGWMLGAVLVMAWRVLRAGCGWWWLRRHSRPADAVATKIAEAAARSFGIKRVPQCLLVEELTSPVITGLTQPRIWLPVEAEEWSEAKLRAVCLHELAHHHRHDGAWQWLGWLTTSAWWWNPLVWMSMRRLAREAEMAADELVLTHDLDAPDYASVLVEIASGEGSPLRGIGVPMLGRTSIEQRVRAILEGETLRTKIGRVAKVVTWVTALLLVVGAGLGVDVMPLPEQQIVKLTPEQRALAEQTVKSLSAYRQQLSRIHYKMERKWSETEIATSREIHSPMATQGEIWYAYGENRYRADWKPEVTPWKNGAAPWFLDNRTEVSDGKRGWIVRHDIDSTPVDRDKGTTINLMDETYIKDALRLLESGLQGSHARSKFELSSAVDAEGNPVMVLKNIGGHREILWEIDPATGMLIHYANRESDTPLPTTEWRLEEKGITKSGVPYPAKFSYNYSTGSQLSRYTTQITELEVIEDIPAELLATPKPPPSPYTATDGKVSQGESVELRFIDESSGKAVPSVTVHYDVTGTEKRQEMTSDESGVARIPLPKEEVTFLRAWGIKKGYVMQRVQWRRYGDPLRLPASYEMKLGHASPIRGVLVDDKGKPVADAQVEVWHSGKVRTWSVYSDIPDNTSRSTKTNAQGEWSMNGFPDDLSRLSLKVTHPEFEQRGMIDYRLATGLDYNSLRDGTSKLVLLRGQSFEVRGAVVNTDGKPVPNCRVSLAEDRYRNDVPTTMSGPDGWYVLRTQKREKTWLCAEAAGYQPSLMEYQIGVVPQSTQRIVLTPSKGLRAQVVDEKGKPIPRAWVVASRWRGHRTLWWETHADAEGRFVWDGAPEDEVMLDLLPDAKRELRDLKVTASDKELTLMVKPAIRFIGSVLDAATNQPIPSFTITGGDTRRSAEDIYWSRDSRVTYRDGRFQWDTWWMREDHKLKIEADGYEPFITEPVTPKQQVVTLAIRLKAR